MIYCAPPIIKNIETINTSFILQQTKIVFLRQALGLSITFFIVYLAKGLLSKYITYAKPLAKLGQYTLFIYLAHTTIFYILDYCHLEHYFSDFSKATNHSFLLELVLTSIICAIIYFIGELCNKQKLSKFLFLGKTK